MNGPNFVAEGRLIGGNASTFIVAEVGANHGGDPGIAHRMIDVAAECGVDAVKFQTYTSTELVADYSRLVTWGPPDGQHTEPIGELFDRVALDRRYHSELFDHAREVSLIPFSTPFSEDGVEFLASIGSPMLKLASSDVSYLDLIHCAMQTGLPVILSTGKSTLSEVADAVDVLRAGSTGGFALLHCVAQYPAPLEALNLKLIRSLGMIFPDAVVGFSDHSIGTSAAMVAVTLGAQILEKHFTLAHDAGGPDDWFSADPEGLYELVSSIRHAESMLGDGRKTISSVELEERRVSTRSVVLAVDKKAGDSLSRSDLKVVRPGYGIAPSETSHLVGLTVNKDLPCNSVLQWDDVT